MMIFAIITLIIIPACLAFLLNVTRAGKGWTYCACAALFNASLLHDPFKNVIAENQGFATKSLQAFFLVAIFYFGAMGLRYLSRWHSDEEKPAAKLPEEKAVVEKQAEPPHRSLNNYVGRVDP
jgi:hypothetical protein